MARRSFVVAGDYARDYGMKAPRIRSVILDYGEVQGMAYAAAVVESPCGACFRAGFVWVLRLRLCLAFRDAQPPLRMTARRGSLRLRLEQEVLVEVGRDRGFRAVDLALVFVRFRNPLRGSRGPPGLAVLPEPVQWGA